MVTPKSQKVEKKLVTRFPIGETFCWGNDFFSISNFFSRFPFFSITFLISSLLENRKILRRENQKVLRRENQGVLRMWNPKLLIWSPEGGKIWDRGLQNGKLQCFPLAVSVCVPYSCTFKRCIILKELYPEKHHRRKSIWKYNSRCSMYKKCKSSGLKNVCLKYSLQSLWFL